jgi:hypothetical protein
LIGSEQTPTEGVTITEFDPRREIEGVHPKLRSCKTCVHANVCMIFEVQAIHTQRLEELSKRSNITLDITPPEAIGVACSEHTSGTTKESKP